MTEIIYLDPDQHLPDVGDDQRRLTMKPPVGAVSPILACLP